MAALASAPPLTVSDYLTLPEAGPRYQLIEGGLIMAPSPSTFHQGVAGKIYRLLCEHVERKRAGVVHIAPLDVYLDDLNVYQPDVVFVAAPRVKKLVQDDGIHGAPDLAVEVLSPGTARLDKDTKRRVYARAGVSELWLVDPELRAVQIYRFAENPDRPVAHLEIGDTLTTPLLKGLAMPLKEVFRL